MAIEFKILDLFSLIRIIDFCTIVSQNSKENLCEIGLHRSKGLEINNSELLHFYTYKIIGRF